MKETCVTRCQGSGEAMVFGLYLLCSANGAVDIPERRCCRFLCARRLSQEAARLMSGHKSRAGWVVLKCEELNLAVPDTNGSGAA